jgi:hypothetical protein
VRELDQSLGEPQLNEVTMDQNPLYPPEHVGQVCGRCADSASDVRQSKGSTRMRFKENLRAPNELARSRLRFQPRDLRGRCQELGPSILQNRTGVLTSLYKQRMWRQASRRNLCDFAEQRQRWSHNQLAVPGARRVTDVEFFTSRLGGHPKPDLKCRSIAGFEVSTEASRYEQHLVGK